MENLKTIWKIDSEEFKHISSPVEKIQFLLRYAILAPSTHNSQPWLFKISNNSCQIYSDQSKRLPQADPLGRDLHISLGCCLENLVTAANYFGVMQSINYFPDDEKNHVAEVTFKNLRDSEYNPAWQPLLTATLHRINARGIFLARSVPPAVISRLNKLGAPAELEVKFITTKNQILQLARLTQTGIGLAYAFRGFRQEAADWINHSWSKKKEGIHGYALRIPGWLSLIFPTLIKRFNLGRKIGLLNLLSVKSAPLITVISARDESELTWLKTGRLAQRLILELNAARLNTSIYVASIEMGQLVQQVKSIINSPLLPQFLFCAGYLPGKFTHTVRWPVENKLLIE